MRQGEEASAAVSAGTGDGAPEASRADDGPEEDAPDEKDATFADIVEDDAREGRTGAGSAEDEDEYAVGEGEDEEDDEATLEEEMRRAAAEEDDDAGAEIDDLGDHLLTPAFVDAHTHLGLVVLRGTGVEEASAGAIM